MKSRASNGAFRFHPDAGQNVVAFDPTMRYLVLPHRVTLFWRLLDHHYWTSRRPTARGPRRQAWQPTSTAPANAATAAKVPKAEDPETHSATLQEKLLAPMILHFVRAKRKQPAHLLLYRAPTSTRRSSRTPRRWRTVRRGHVRPRADI